MKNARPPRLQSHGHRYHTRKGILRELPVWIWFNPVKSVGKNRMPGPSPPLVFQRVLDHSGNNPPICFLLSVKSMLKELNEFR